MHKKHRDGKICELILEEFLFRRGYWVFKPIGEPSPADFIALSPSGDIFLFDAKKDGRRVNPNRTKPSRIYRPRSDVQKMFNIRMAYVNLDTRAVVIVPPLEDHLASPQDGPISTSHLDGTSSGTAVSMILATLFASSTFFTDMAISSWI